MRIQTSNRTFDFEQLAERALSGADYETGQLEELASTTTKQSRAIGRLIEFLVNKKLMKADEVQEVLGMYEEVKFIE